MMGKSLFTWKKQANVAKNHFGKFGNQDMQVILALRNVQENVQQLPYQITGIKSKELHTYLKN